MLIIDGVRYRQWTPKNEEKEFHPMIIKCSKDIFGENSLYLPIEKRLVSKAGTGVFPDGFAIIFSKSPEIHIVEIELSKHDLDKHIVEQLNRFGRAIKNPVNKKIVADKIYDEIKSDPMKEAFVRKMIGSQDPYKFLSDLVSQPLKIVVIIDKKNRRVVEACENLKVSPRIIRFKTFARQDAPNVNAYLFEPLHTLEKASEKGKEEEKEYAERHILRKEFWTSLLEKAKEKTDLHSNVSPHIYHWIATGAGKSGIVYGYVITMKNASCEIYFDKGKAYEKPNINKARFDQLYKYKKEIEKEFGGKLNWERLDNRRASRISVKFEGVGLKNKDKWESLQDKMIETMIRLEKAFGTYIKKLK